MVAIKVVDILLSPLYGGKVNKRNYINYNFIFSLNLIRAGLVGVIPLFLCGGVIFPTFEFAVSIIAFYFNFIFCWTFSQMLFVETTCRKATVAEAL